MQKSKRNSRNWRFNTIQTRIRTTPMARRKSSRRLLTRMKYCQTKRSVKYITSKVKRACASMNRCKVKVEVEDNSSITWTLTTSSPISSVAAEDRLAVEAVVVTTNSSTSTTEAMASSIITSNNSKKLSQISLRTQMCTVLTLARFSSSTAGNKSGSSTSLTLNSKNAKPSRMSTCKLQRNYTE